MIDFLTSLRDTYAKLKAMPPVVTQIWFVETPRAYERFWEMLQATEAPLPNPYGNLFGIRLFNVTLADMTTWTPERLEYLKIPTQPGVWCVMSDGSVQSLALSDHEQIARLYVESFGVKS